MRALATALTPALRALPLDAVFDTKVTEVPRTRQSCEAFAAARPSSIRANLSPAQRGGSEFRNPFGQV